METTFISIHDLSCDARILYVSNSITDILGHRPEQVIGKSCWQFFHPDEVPFARMIHNRGVELDKAAVLHYCQIKNSAGIWIGCECVFTVVHDVIVGCTSIYRQDAKSQKRAEDAPIIRQIFSSSPRDPRYHMLSYISPKFQQKPAFHLHEPRAAFFLNRFTRTLPIMYATNGLFKLLGISAEELVGKSFYFCIQENCLTEAVKCMESAKENDSIAYLRFWYRRPREDDTEDSDDSMSDGHSSDQDDGGVDLDSLMDTDSDHAVISDSSGRPGTLSESARWNSRSSSGTGTDVDVASSGQIFEHSATVDSSSSSIASASNDGRASRHRRPPAMPLELEAVVSCTSDGLVVVLRAARPFLPTSVRLPQRIPKPAYVNGLFASPWAAQPIMPSTHYADFNVNTNSYHYPTVAPQPPPKSSYSPRAYSPTSHRSTAHQPPSGPSMDDFMTSIRDVAVFAWSLTGINGSLAQYSRGRPRSTAVPATGYPIWDPSSNAGPEIYRPNPTLHHNDNSNIHARPQTSHHHHPPPLYGLPRSISPPSPLPPPQLSYTATVSPPCFVPFVAKAAVTTYWQDTVPAQSSLDPRADQCVDERMARSGQHAWRGSGTAMKLRATSGLMAPGPRIKGQGMGSRTQEDANVD